VVFGDNTSGSGAVTLTGGWDISARPYDIEVAGGSITTGGITLGSYDLTLNALAGDVNVDAASTFTKSTGTDMTLLMKASNSILLNGTLGNTISLTSSSNKMNITLNSDRDASGAGAIKLAYTTITSNNGDIVLGGGANPLTTDAYSSGANVHGVEINVSTLTSDVGDINIRGRSVAGGTSRYGVYVYGGSQLNTSNGDVSITGRGVSGDTSNIGVYVTGNGTQVNSVDGDINLTGYGGGSGSTGISNFGVSVIGLAQINATNNATITLTGTGGNSTGASFFGTSLNHGVYIGGTQAINSLHGAITLVGQGGGSGSGNLGLWFNGSQNINSLGTAPITLTGTGGTGTSQNDGINFSVGTSVNSVTGNIVMTGIGGNAASNGIRVYNGATFNSTGSANITLTGTANGGLEDIHFSTSGSNNIIGNNTMTGDIRLNMNSSNLSGLKFRTTGDITFAPRTAATTIGVNGGAGTLQLGNSILNLVDTTTVSPSLVVFGDNSSGSGVVNIATGWDISAYNFDVEVAGGSITARSVTGGTGNLTLRALSGDISNPTGTLETTSGDINLYGQNISVNALDAGSGDILLDATGSINDLTDGGDNIITTGNLTLTSGSHVGNGSATGLNVDVGGTININTTGNITLTEGANLNIGTISASGNITLAAQSGVAGAGMGILAVEDGDIILTGSISGAQVLLEADGNILDGNVGATDIIATAGSTLNAGGWIGTWANPLEIQITGGTMDIRPLGITGLISTVINGSVAPVDTLTLLNSPLAQVWYNGVLLWGTVPVSPPTTPSGGSSLFDDWIGGDWNAIRYPAFVYQGDTNEDAIESRLLYSSLLSDENPQLMNRYIVPHILSSGILFQQEWARQIEDLQAPSDEAISKFLLGETSELRKSLSTQ